MKTTAKAFPRLAAAVLSVMLLLAAILLAVFVADAPAAAGEITAIAALAPVVSARSVAFGTQESALALPGALSATVALPPAAAPGEEGQPPTEPPATAQADVPVRWSAEPAFAPETPGDYVFTPQVDGAYTLAADVALPTVTITVLAQAPSAAPVVIAAFAPVMAPVARPGMAEADIVALLPGTLVATVQGGEADAHSVAVSGWIWQKDDPATAAGVYVFAPTLALAENESLAEGVSAPTVTVRTPTAANATAAAVTGAINTYSNVNEDTSNSGFTAGPNGNTVTVTDIAPTGTQPPGVQGTAQAF